MGDGKRIMLVWAASDGSLHSRVWTAGAFAAETALPGYVSHGSIALGRLGASLYLFARLDSGSDALSMISYNTASFNIVTVPTNPYGGPQDNTTSDAWSPSAFPEWMRSRPASSSRFRTRTSHEVRSPVRRSMGCCT
jgi:hypothetical protein